MARKVLLNFALLTVDLRFAMSRKLCMAYPGALFHVVSRGAGVQAQEVLLLRQ